MNQNEYFEKVSVKKAEINRIKRHYIAPIEDELHALETEMLNDCPFKINDKVIISERGRNTPKEVMAYVSAIKVATRIEDFWNCEGYIFEFVKVKANGFPSKNKFYLHPVRLSDISKA